MFAFIVLDADVVETTVVVAEPTILMTTICDTKLFFSSLASIMTGKYPELASLTPWITPLTLLSPLGSPLTWKLTWPDDSVQESGRVTFWPGLIVIELSMLSLSVPQKATVIRRTKSIDFIENYRRSDLR